MSKFQRPEFCGRSLVSLCGPKTPASTKELLQALPPGFGEANVIVTTQTASSQEIFLALQLSEVQNELQSRMVSGICRLLNEEETAQVSAVFAAGEAEEHRLATLCGARAAFTIADGCKEELPLIYANSSFTELTGYSLNEILNRSCTFLQRPETCLATRKMLRAFLDYESEVKAVLLNFKKDNTPFWNVLRLAPLRGADGFIMYYLGVQCDLGRYLETAHLGMTRDEYLEVYTTQKARQLAFSVGAYKPVPDDPACDKKSRRDKVKQHSLRLGRFEANLPDMTPTLGSSATGKTSLWDDVESPKHKRARSEA